MCLGGQSSQWRILSRGGERGDHSALPCLLGIDQEGKTGLNNAGVSVGGEAGGNDWLCNEDNCGSHDT